MPSTQLPSQSVSLSDIVRATAVLTASGFLSVGAGAANDANRPEPAPRATAAQDAPPAEPSGDPVDPPAEEPQSGDPVDAPRATDPAPAPLPAQPRDTTPEPQDRRTVAGFRPTSA